MQGGVFEKAGRWLDRHKLTTALIVAAVGLAFAGNLFSCALNPAAGLFWRLASGALLFVTVIAVIYGCIAQAAAERRVGVLLEERDNLTALVTGFGSDYFDIWNKRLQVLAEELSFNGQDRISVYRHDSNSFTMVGRYSILPDLAKPGRSIYPADQGIIGAAWRSADGKCVVTDLPDPDTSFNEYADRNLAEWQVPPDVTHQMNMKSRSIAAFALSDPVGKSRNAIIVFESMMPNRFTAAAIEKRLNGSASKEIVHMLQILRDREPSLEYARGKGF